MATVGSERLQNRSNSTRRIAEDVDVNEMNDITAKQPLFRGARSANPESRHWFARTTSGFSGQIDIVNLPVVHGLQPCPGMTKGVYQ